MILVVGRTGQLACELGRLPNTRLAGREVADLTDPQACAQLIRDARPSSVINAAAYTNVDRAEENEAEAHVINADAPAKMAQACLGLDIPFVNVSTDYVFDGTGTEPRAPDAKTGPLSAYGRTKLAGEVGVNDIGGRSVSMRTSWVFSAHGTNFVKTMLRLSNAHEGLRVVSDQIGGPTSAGSIAAACIRMAETLAARDRCFDRVYHFAGTPAVSWADFARQIFTATGLEMRVKNILTSDYPTAAVRPRNSRLDCETFERDFDMETPEWKADLRRVLNELKETT